jgi:hypothetical protein
VINTKPGFFLLNQNCTFMKLWHKIHWQIRWRYWSIINVCVCVSKFWFKKFSQNFTKNFYVRMLRKSFWTEYIFDLLDVVTGRRNLGFGCSRLQFEQSILVFLDKRNHAIQIRQDLLLPKKFVRKAQFRQFDRKKRKMLT